MDFSGGPIQFVMNIPVVTRLILIGQVVLALGVKFGLWIPADLHLNSTLVFKAHEVHRIITSALYVGPLNLNTVLTIAFTTVGLCGGLENSMFSHMPFQFLFALGVCLFSAVALESLPWVTFNSLFGVISSFVIYLHSRYSGGTMLIMFVPVASGLAPLILLLARVLQGSEVLPALIGFGIGHIYYYFDTVYPVMTDKSPIATLRRRLGIHWLDAQYNRVFSDRPSVDQGAWQSGDIDNRR